MSTPPQEPGPTPSAKRAETAPGSTPPATSGSAPGSTSGSAPGSSSGTASGSTSSTAKPGTKPKDPLRGSRTSGAWVFIVLLVLLLIMLAIFILQNTQSVEVSFLGWTGSAPLSASLLIAAVTGMVLVVCAGALRILQLRRRVKRARKS